MRRSLLAIGLAAVLAVTLVFDQRLESMVQQETEHRDLLYLPNGAQLQVASLGYQSLLADLVYLWAIQFYSDYSREDRYLFVEHIFANVIAELDPRFIDAYSLGSLLLSIETQDLDRALALLDLGIEKNPDNWLLPLQAGFDCYRIGRSEQAAEYFGRLATLQGVPSAIVRTSAGMLQRSGSLQQSYTLWKEILDDPDSDELSVEVAERNLASLTKQLELGWLRDGVAQFARQRGRPPFDLRELVDAGLIQVRPEALSGLYEYNPLTGEVYEPQGDVFGPIR